jgi:hypothetical protein
MNEIENISPRASLKRNGEDLSLVIMSSTDKSKAKYIGTIMVLWLVGGIYIGINYFRITDSNEKVMIIVWMAFWLYFSYIILKSFFWQYSGKEIIQVRNGKLFYKKDTSGRGWVQNYKLENLKNLKKYEDKSPSWSKKFGGDYWSTDCDSLSFEYEEKEIAFGYRLTEKESEKIQKILKPFFAVEKK